MGKKLATIQSNYLPWKGYFDIINMVDEFVFYDHVQYTKEDWRNRNKIKTPNGPQWLTIPVLVKGRLGQKVCEAETLDTDWGRSHWSTITQNYSRAPFFKQYRERFEELFLGVTSRNLSQNNYRFIEAICEMLEIKTRLSRSMDYDLTGDRVERLAELCVKLGATEYVSGPNAKGYLDESVFTKAGLSVRWMDYSAYREYNQQYPPFVHQVSVIDLIFSEGPRAREFLLTAGK